MMHGIKDNFVGTSVGETNGLDTYCKNPFSVATMFREKDALGNHGNTEYISKLFPAFDDIFFNHNSKTQRFASYLGSLRSIANPSNNGGQTMDFHAIHIFPKVRDQILIV